MADNCFKCGKKNLIRAVSADIVQICIHLCSSWVCREQCPKWEKHFKVIRQYCKPEKVPFQRRKSL